MELSTIISACKRGERQAQKKLYDLYAPVFLSIARRYMKDIQDAEDMVLEGFFKIFSNLSQYHGNGSFEGWMKRIVINQCLMQLRKQKNLRMTVEVMETDKVVEPTIMDKLLYEELVGLLDALPIGYRTIFNLYLIEGFKHREIAEKLGISINTSKSQLILAKKRMQELIKKKQLNVISIKTS